MREGLYPALFVVLWATGFIGARYAMPWCEPFFFLAARFLIAGAILAVVAVVANAKWPNRAVAIHGIPAGLGSADLYAPRWWRLPSGADELSGWVDSSAQNG